jgi:serine/threonine protein kinase
MNPNRWQEIDKLLSEALKRESGQRKDFLERACAGDDELCKEVGVLLEAHDRAGSFMDKPALEASASSPPPSLTGRKSGPFEILSLLGRGGMGEVYKVRDTRLDRINALKILPPELARDPDRLHRFIREAKAASALNHPNIATIYEIGESDGIHWIAMELVEGQTLAERIRDRPLETDEILDIGIQAAEALAEAHSKGIIHRDIKPANLMLTPKGVVKILDFGLAKRERRESLATGADTTGTHTVPGLVMGTARYMSPEQVLGQSVDHRTDIFSLGVVLYEMAAGQPPFRGESPSAILDAIVHRTPAWPPRVQDMVPEELKRIISKALEKFREVRYDAASELSADLKRLKRDSESGKSAASLVLTRPTLPRPKMKVWLGIAGMLAIIAVPLGWYLFRQRADTMSEPLRIVPFTSLPGIEAAPRFSPDGKFVAFQWNGPTEDNWDIYVKQVAHGEEPFRLTRDPAADRLPVWSPDGGEVAFVRVSGETTSIYTLPFPQGAERRLYELKVPSLASDLSWSPDGRLLAFSEKSAVKSPARIYLLSPDTQQTTPLTSPPPGIDGDFSPEFSPDGKRLAFARRTGYAVRDIWIQTLPSGEATRLTHESYTDISRPTWAANR